MLTSSYS